MNIKSQTLIEYNNGVDLNISDSIIFSSNEQKADLNDSDKADYDTMNKPSLISMPFPGIIIIIIIDNINIFSTVPEEVVYSEKIDCQKVFELLKTPTVLLIYAQGFPG